MCSTLVSATDEGGIADLATLQARGFAAFRSACRKPRMHLSSCMFNTTPSNPANFKFVLEPVSMPFKMRFDVKASGDATIALAENKTVSSTFAQISIGGWSNSKSAIRACDEPCAIQVEDEESGLLSETEYRPFWLEYNGGVVNVGKGNQSESFLEWDAGSVHSKTPPQVYVGISTHIKVSGSWVFYNLCG
ncbi:C3 and PZP-like alpha-2-macroglobulin domain-containing protein 8 isoform X2 [Asterias amurensis]